MSGAAQAAGGGGAGGSGSSSPRTLSASILQGWALSRVETYFPEFEELCVESLLTRLARRHMIDTPAAFC